MKFAALSAGLLALSVIGGTAEEMKPPRLSFAQVDWAAAAATLADIDELRPLPTAATLRPVYAGANRAVPRALARLNIVMSPRFPNVSTSPVPTLSFSTS